MSTQLFALFGGGGGEWVDPSCLDYLQEAKLQIDLEPAEKRADSQVLVLGFRQAPLSTSCMPQPLGPRPFLPCSLQHQHADTFTTTGFGFRWLEDKTVLEFIKTHSFMWLLQLHFLAFLTPLWG